MKHQIAEMNEKLAAPQWLQNTPQSLYSIDPIYFDHMRRNQSTLMGTQSLCQNPLDIDAPDLYQSASIVAKKGHLAKPTDKDEKFKEYQEARLRTRMDKINKQDSLQDSLQTDSSIKLQQKSTIQSNNSGHGEPASPLLVSDQKEQKKIKSKQFDMNLEQKEEMEIRRIKFKKNSYIKNCIKRNDHYTEEKLRSLNWMRKENVDFQSVALRQQEQKVMEKYKERQEILAKYNQMSKDNGHYNLENDGTYKYTIIKGNNSGLIRRVLQTRENWSELVEKHLKLFNFKWAPLSRCCNFDQLCVNGQKKLINHFERHEHLSTKDLLFQNMWKFCEQNKQDVFQYLPTQFVLDFASKDFTREMDQFCQYFNCIERVKLTEKGEISDQEILDKINKSINSNKILQKPKSGPVSKQYKLLNEMYNGKNVWLIKPRDFNRGRGVKLFNTLDQLKTMIREFTKTNSNGEMYYLIQIACHTISQNEKNLFPNKKIKEEYEELKVADTPMPDPSITPCLNPNISQQLQTLDLDVKSEVFVIQKYLERPLLIDERKFDIRLWILVAPDHRCYLFKEGYIRTSSQKYNLDQSSLQQPFIHLTNNAVQQFDENYGKLEEGNQMSFAQASKIIKEQQGVEVDFHQLLQEEMVPVINMTLQSTDGKINPNQRKFCFEIFGYDFMVDENLKSWLIEVNTNPCLEETSALLREYIPRMIDDAFRLTLDVLYPPTFQPSSTCPDSVGPTTDHRSLDTITLNDKKFASQSSMASVTEDHRPREPQCSPFKVAGFPDDVIMWQHIHTLKY